MPQLKLGYKFFTILEIVRKELNNYLIYMFLIGPKLMKNCAQRSLVPPRHSSRWSGSPFCYVPCRFCPGALVY